MLAQRTSLHEELGQNVDGLPVDLLTIRKSFHLPHLMFQILRKKRFDSGVHLILLNVVLTDETILGGDQEVYRTIDQQHQTQKLFGENLIERNLMTQLVHQNELNVGETGDGNILQPFRVQKGDLLVEV